MTLATRIARGVLILVLAVSAAIALGTYAEPDGFERDAKVLIATFGVLAAVLGIGAVLAAPGSRTATLSLWALPLFFVGHVAAFGTVLPDGVFALLTAAAAGVLTLARPRPSTARVVQDHDDVAVPTR